MPPEIAETRDALPREQPYRLSSHAYACMTNGFAVFLNLEKDTYTAFEPAELPGLHDLVQGWAETYARAGNATGYDRKLENVLLDEGLVTRHYTLGKDPIPASLESVTASSFDGLTFTRRPTPRDVYRFNAAHVSITAMLKLWSIDRIVRRFRTRRASVNAESREFNASRAQDLVACYYQLQPEAFSAINACLRNSLTLAEFLALYGLYPRLAFGVRMDPWGAHAWLQHGAVVLNDRVEHIRLYTPILVA